MSAVERNDMRFLLPMAMACAAVLAASPGQSAAQSCAGFTDVASSSTFCPNVEWLKNRAITLGCTSATLYCPTDPVTRIAMAAFMNRLGKALSPEVLAAQASPGALTLPSSAPLATRCVTGDSTVATYPRSATVYATLTGLADGNAVGWRARAVYSTDGGTTWQATPGAVAGRASSAAGQWSGATAIAMLDVAPNVAYRFAIQLARDELGPATTGQFVQSHCNVTATVDNRNGSSSPFDVSTAVSAAGQR